MWVSDRRVAAAAGGQKKEKKQKEKVDFCATDVEMSALPPCLG